MAKVLENEKWPDGNGAVRPFEFNPGKALI
jgi:hypothetical protein